MKTFHPIRSTFVDASAPHPANTQYRVSVGNEFFENVPQTVVVVQMVYNGKVEGRKVQLSQPTPMIFSSE